MLTVTFLKVASCLHEHKSDCGAHPVDDDVPSLEGQEPGIISIPSASGYTRTCLTLATSCAKVLHVHHLQWKPCQGVSQICLWPRRNSDSLSGLNFMH